MIGVTEARRQLEELVERAVKGETIAISKRGKPAVRLMPLDAPPAYPADAGDSRG